MRRLLIASVILVFGGTATLASAADTAPVATTTSTEQATTPPAPVDPLAHIQGRPDARSLPMDQLWTEFELAFAEFEGALASTDDASPETQTGFRNYVQAIESAASVRDLLGAMLERDELDENDRLDALDSYLTIAQVSGSLMVEIQQCKRGAQTLRALAAKPETVERPLLHQGTTQWLAKAERCVERQNLQAQIAERESQSDEAELARLRAELAAAVQEDEDITREEQRASGDDELVLSRAELLALLRESAGDRRGSSLMEHPRAHLPSHEYGIEFRGGFTHVPNFVIGMLYEKHGEAGPEAQYGGSFFVRKNNRERELSLNYDYTQIDLGDSWWVRKGKSRGSARWMEIASPKHTITLGIDRNFPIGRQERFQFHVGGMFGISVLSDSTFPRSRVDQGACLIGISGATSGHLDLFEEGGACYDALDPNNSKPLKLPAVLPSIGMRLGMRYVIADRVQVGLEGGIQDMYFYANANVGVIVGRKYKNR